MNRYRISLPYIGLGLLVFLAACSSTNTLEECQGVAIQEDNCLVFESELPAHRATIEQVVAETFRQVNALMPIDEMRIVVIEDAAQTIPELGIGGFNPGTDEVRLFMDPGSPFFSSSLENDLLPMLAHELHHANRRRAVGYGATLFEAMVSEGLADHFSIEVAGIDPPIWTAALSEVQEAEWRERAAETWADSPYDHGLWFFGIGGEVPRWAGYTIGFQIVQDYLAAHPGTRASALFNLEAAAFLP